RQIEAIAVEGHKLRAQLLDALDEAADQLLLRTIANMRRTERLDAPAFALASADQRADANNPVQRMLRKCPAQSLADLIVGFAVEAQTPTRRVEVEHGFQIPHDYRVFSHPAVLRGNARARQRGAMHGASRALVIGDHPVQDTAIIPD